MHPYTAHRPGFADTDGSIVRAGINWSLHLSKNVSGCYNYSHVERKSACSGGWGVNSCVALACQLSLGAQPETEAYLWTLFDFCVESPPVYVLFRSSPPDLSSCPCFPKYRLSPPPLLLLHFFLYTLKSWTAHYLGDKNKGFHIQPSFLFHSLVSIYIVIRLLRV